MFRTLLSLLLWLGWAVFYPTFYPTGAAEPVTVLLKNGQRLKGQLDPRTDAERLWLRFGGETTRILRGVPWTDIRHAAVSEEPLSEAALRERANTAPPQAPLVRLPPRASQPMAGNSEGADDRRSLPPSTGRPPRLGAIQFDAAIANWDDDVETDGLLVELDPRSTQGERMLVAGILHATLWAMRRVEQHAAPRSGGRSWERVGEWTMPVPRPSVDGELPLLRLPFQTPHPEFDTRWSSVGLLHVSLTAPGSGVFHQTLDGLRIRPFAPYRDAWERETGERFLPTELTGRK